MDNQFVPTDVSLIVDPQDLSFYTTLLQVGIEIKVAEGETVAQLLDKLPGFTIDYVSNVIQTIFLNGTAIDDLSSPFTGKAPVVALSAAMPGLAGAIFRRNSFHAALRTPTDTLPKKQKEPRSGSVCLKLFNSIALERGPSLLEQGVNIKTSHFTDFLTRRIPLKKRIRQMDLSGLTVTRETLIARLADIETINLKIKTKPRTL